MVIPDDAPPEFLELKSKLANCMLKLKQGVNTQELSVKMLMFLL